MDPTEIIIEALGDGLLDPDILGDSARDGRWGILAVRDSLLPDEVADNLECGGVVRQLLFQALRNVDWDAVESWVEADRAAALADEFGGPEQMGG